MQSSLEIEWRSGSDRQVQWITRQINWPARTEGLGQILAAGLLRDWAYATEEARTCDYFIMVYSLEGRCQYAEPGQPERPFTDGELLLVPPGVPHMYGPVPPTRWSQFYVQFKGPVFDLWRDRLLGREARFFRLLPVDYWLERLRSALKMLPADDGGDPIALSAFQGVLGEILATTHPRPSEADVRWLALAKSAMERVERADTLDLPAIAGQLNLSYDNFRKKFARLAHTTPLKFHTAVLMHRACHLLIGRKITDWELCEQLGYSDPYYFTQRFRQVIGMTPRQFRRSMTGPQR